MENMDAVAEMELEATIPQMLSDDYKERFIAEFKQAFIRFEKLGHFIEYYRAGTLSFIPDCSIELLSTQYSILGAYISILNERARIENINLPNFGL